MILHVGLVWHPVGLAQPHHVAAQGQPSSEPVYASCALPWAVVW